MTVLTGCQCWGPESGSLSPPTGFQTDKNCEALINICQGSPCLGSGAVTWDIATAMAAAVGRQPCQGYFRFLQVFLAPLSKASRNALNYSRTKRPLWPPFLGGQHSANLATVRVGFLSWVGRDCLCP